jgi:hypothetical protein
MTGIEDGIGPERAVYMERQSELHLHSVTDLVRYAIRNQILAA